MDLITHAAASAAAAVTFARGGQVRTAAVAGGIGGLLPDTDMLIASGADPLLNLEFHRHFTHALAFAPIGAALAAAVAWLVLRHRPRWRSLYPSALAGYLAALLLDACTSYGTHLFWPFEHAPVAFSIVSVIDPLFTLLVGVPLMAAVVKRARAWAHLGMALAVAWLAFGAIQHSRALDAAAQLAAARGHQPSRMLVKPTLGNLVLWRSLYVHGHRIHVDAVRVGLPGAIRVYPGESAERFDPGRDASLAPGSRVRHDVERFVTFADGLTVRHPLRPDIIGDARYAMLPTSIAPLWGVRVNPEAPQQPVEFVQLRAADVQTRSRFIAMLLARELPDEEAREETKQQSPQ